jgi:hypothetical protein
MASSLIANYVHIDAAMKTRSPQSTPGRPVHPAAAAGAQAREVGQHTLSRRAKYPAGLARYQTRPFTRCSSTLDRLHGPGCDPNQRLTVGVASYRRGDLSGPAVRPVVTLAEPLASWPILTRDHRAGGVRRAATPPRLVTDLR